MFNHGMVRMAEAEHMDLSSIDHWYGRIRARVAAMPKKVKLPPPQPVIPHPSRRR